jgi:hypothetical protein
MLTDADIWRAATLLVQEHGDEAALAAVNRALELLDQGDAGGARAWERITDAIAWLQSDSPGGAKLH